MRKDVNDMFEIKGKVTTAICYAKVIEDEAIEQIRRMCDYDLTRGNQIELILSYDSILPSPTRSLSAFSRELIRLNEESHCLTDAIYNHTLFQTQLINMKKDINSTKEITEAELIVAITNLLFKPSNYNSMYRSNTINKLKELMLPFIR